MSNLPKSSATNSGLAIGNQKALGHLAALAFALLIAGAFSIGHVAAPYLSPAALNAVRFVLAVILLVGFLRITTGAMPRPPKAAWRFLILGGLMAVYFITMFAALQITNPVSTGAVFTLIPLMSAGFGWLMLRQSTNGVVLVSLIVAASGAIWVIFRGDLNAILSFRIGKGEMIFFYGCVCHALIVPLIRKFNRGENGLYFALGSISGTALWIVLAAIPDLPKTDWFAMPLIVWLAIGYLTIFTTAVTYFLVQFASMRLPASKVLSYGYITPAAIIVIEGIVGHGWASWSVMVGALLTAAALAVMAFAPDN